MSNFKNLHLAIILALFSFQVTAQVAKLQSDLAGTFEKVFIPENSVLHKFMHDGTIATKLDDFHKKILEIALFVNNNNKGLILGASSTLTEANNALVTETAKFVSSLKEMAQRLQNKKTLEGDGNASYVEGQRFHIDFSNMLPRITKAEGTLKPKINDYKSTGQKEAYAVLMDGFKTLSNAIENVKKSMVYGQWLKK